MNNNNYNKNKYDNYLNILSNGPITNTISGIISLICSIISFIILLFLTLGTINNYNIQKKYKQTTATITKVSGIEKYEVKYYIDNKEYVSELFDIEEYNVGDIITICYNPKDYNYITYKPQEITFDTILPNIFALLFFIISVISTKTHFNNVKYYIDPEHNTLVEGLNTTTIGINNTGFTIGYDNTGNDENNEL